MTLRYICQCFMLVRFLSSYVCAFNFFFLVASSMGFKPILAACHIFTIPIVVCFCNVVANKVLSLSLSLSSLSLSDTIFRNE